jgi:hypothetical protein
MNSPLPDTQHELNRPIRSLRFGRVRRYPELERLICAAICNTRFATMLLTTPERALAYSEIGQRLSPDERALVLSIRDAPDIYEYAGRLHRLIAQHRSM